MLVAAHGNSLRALVKYLDGISDEDIAGLNIPTGNPLRYDLDDNLKPLIGGTYLIPKPPLPVRQRLRRRARSRPRNSAVRQTAG